MNRGMRSPRFGRKILRISDRAVKNQNAIALRENIKTMMQGRSMERPYTTTKKCPNHYVQCYVY
jgi:hypothetical protein